MENILKKPKDTIVLKEGRYEKLNLTENPFPVTPAINKDNSDIRYNGKIYESRIRESEFQKIEENFLKIPQSDPNHLRLGYIIDASYVGRGNGKSAFSINLQKKINKNFCLDISSEVNKCFGLYISPEPSGRTKSFYNLIDLIFESILELNIIEYCLASLRLEAILSLKKDFDISQAFQDQSDDIINKLNDIKWYKDQGIEVASVAKKIFENEILGKLSSGFPLRKDKSNFYGTYLVGKNHFRDYYYLELKKGKERLDFIFTDLVNLFLASGFNGAYIVVDDFERIPDFQGDRQKREFALELRTNLFDGTSQNAKIGFYNFILVLHAGVPRLVEKAWSDTGMEQRSPLSPENYNSRHIIIFEKLTPDYAVLLVKKYLSEYRISENTDELKPFTEEAIFLISEKSELNAAKILEKANQLIEKAVEENVDEINRAFVEKIFGESKEDEKIRYDDVANEHSTNLFDKAKED